MPSNWQCLVNLKMCILFDPEMLTLSEIILRSYVPAEICTRIFTAALIAILVKRNWKPHTLDEQKNSSTNCDIFMERV